MCAVCVPLTERSGGATDAWAMMQQRCGIARPRGCSASCYGVYKLQLWYSGIICVYIREFSSVTGNDIVLNVCTLRPQAYAGTAHCEQFQSPCHQEVMLFLFPSLHGALPVRRLDPAAILNRFPRSVAYDVLNSSLLAEQVGQRLRPALAGIKPPRVRVQALVNYTLAVLFSFHFSESSFGIIRVRARSDSGTVVEHLCPSLPGREQHLVEKAIAGRGTDSLAG